jgi:hypothetical protein
VPHVAVQQAEGDLPQRAGDRVDLVSTSMQYRSSSIDRAGHPRTLPSMSRSRARWPALRHGIHALARDHGISRATAHRDLDKVITVLADEAPGLHQALAAGGDERQLFSGLSSLPMRNRGTHDGQPVWLCDALAGQAAGVRGHVHAAEVMAVRPEDKNARQVQQAFADGATLAELEQHIAFLRSLDAPDDAHPRVGVNDDYEVSMMICVVERPALQVSSAS